MRFAKNLKAVAYAKNRSTRFGKGFNRFHYGGKLGDGASPYVVAVGKTTWQYHTIHVRQIGVFMPEFDHILAHHVTQDVCHVVVAIGTGKNNNSEFHEISIG